MLSVSLSQFPITHSYPGHQCGSEMVEIEGGREGGREGVVVHKATIFNETNMVFWGVA